MPSYTTKANLDHLYTKIRDVQTDNTTFRRYAKRLMTVVCEEALSYVSPKQCVVKTPVDDYEYEVTWFIKGQPPVKKAKTAYNYGSLYLDTLN